MAVLDALRREVLRGQKAPRGYQLAWYEPRRRVNVYFPPPLHWLLRLYREVRHKVLMALGAPLIERTEELEMQRACRERELLANEFARGYISGWRESFQTCLNAIEEELSYPCDVWEAGEWLCAAGHLKGPKN